ncbi:GNAT family N-acetyltransferase [Deinococcus arenicola]|uniref:GNAT family N-acetyltransferase n=1 Tax=Deinococcus arenicola TaxID=2994950 RepID=A0ABU4DRZ9_9DEIO|nr:GNAT family N-acetyltransferase [Deinococcus sp. ZS9-10]MDV6374752.1 GNAT family N-acetyltransferase [Deinococcus sp. ZS9-10]
MTTQTLNIKTYKLGPDAPDELSAEDTQRVAEFLHTHLDEYGDALEDIQACLVYAKERGGSVTYAEEDGEILGAVITNRTGMSRFIPENILVYIAVHGKTRGRGLGKQLMEMVLDNMEGSVALHVEAHNPAKKLYERLGFTNKYLEMRLQR